MRTPNCSGRATQTLSGLALRYFRPWYIRPPIRLESSKVNGTPSRGRFLDGHGSKTLGVESRDSPTNNPLCERPQHPPIHYCTWLLRSLHLILHYIWLSALSNTSSSRSFYHSLHQNILAENLLRRLYWLRYPLSPQKIWYLSHPPSIPHGLHL
jgi:hypothetical protein